MSRRLFVSVAVALSLSVSAARAQHKVTVSAGDFARHDCVVQFKLPEDTEPGGYALPDEAGQRTPLQLGPAGRATFILGDLKARQTRTYGVGEGGGEGFNDLSRVEASRDGDQLTFRAGGKEILRYQGAKTPLPQGYRPEFQRGGYIYPLY